MILASASPRRQSLLADLVPSFAVEPAGIDESLPPGIKAEAAVVRLARAKAEAVAQRHPGRPVLAADTLVEANDGAILGQPTDESEAIASMRRLSSGEHRVWTGWCLIDADGRVQHGREATVIRLDPPPGLLEAYVAQGTWQGRAGGYDIEDALLAPHLLLVEGTRENAMGLPIGTLAPLLASLGPVRP
ncbi:MAG: Maf family protein [Thermoplasmatota archaeon]